MTFPAAKVQRSQRVIQLDFVRGLAILAVMEYHFMTVPVHNPLARAFEYAGKRLGWMGVDFFFVLSGFLVGGLLVQELLRSHDVAIRRFLVRRALKIWPAYYAYLLFQSSRENTRFTRTSGKISLIFRIMREPASTTPGVLPWKSTST